MSGMQAGAAVRAPGAPAATPMAAMVMQAATEALPVVAPHHQGDLLQPYALFSPQRQGFSNNFFFFFSLKKAPVPSNVLGVFGLSIRTQERDLDDEFSRYGRVEKVTIVYDQRVCLASLFQHVVAHSSPQSDRSRGFGFIKMSTTEEATKCIQALNGIVRNARRLPHVLTDTL